MFPNLLTWYILREKFNKCVYVCITFVLSRMIRRYGHFSLFKVVIYKVDTNAELVNMEPLLLGNIWIRAFPHTFSSANQKILCVFLF